MARVLQEHCGDVTFLGPINSWPVSLGKIGAKALKKLTGITYLYRRFITLCKVIPFVDKNKPDGCRLLSKLFVQADLFVLPTRVDCSPIALCEANAFGLPVVATDRGGVSGIVRTGENECLFPPTARGSDYAEVIPDPFSQRAKHLELRKNARAHFESRLNWDVWGATVSTLISGLAHGALIGDDCRRSTK
jgi:glycosyltransferase involved in cell wall biosynthesis